MCGWYFLEYDAFCSVKEYSKYDASNVIRIQRSVLILVPFIDDLSLFFILSSSSGASVVAIDNKIEQAMVCTDLKLLVLSVGTAQKARDILEGTSASLSKIQTVWLTLHSQKCQR